MSATTFTNLYEIKITPPLPHLYITDTTLKNLPEEIVGVRLTSESIITFEKLESSRTLSVKLPLYTAWLLRQLLVRSLRTSPNLFFDIDERTGEFTIPTDALYKSSDLSVLRRVRFKILDLDGRFFIAVLPHLALYNRVSLAKLLSQFSFPKKHFIEHNRALIFVDKNGNRSWESGFIKTIEDDVKVEVPSLFNGTINVEASRVIPRLSKHNLLLNGVQNPGELTRILLGISGKESTDLHTTTNRIVNDYFQKLLNRRITEHEFSLSPNPSEINILRKISLGGGHSPRYIVNRNKEEFNHSKKLQALSSANVKSNYKPVHVVIFATHENAPILRQQIAALNNGITQGAYSFDIRSKFGIELKLVGEFITNTFAEYLNEADKFIYSTEDYHQNAIAIAFLPENSDLYYKFKAKLAAHGKVSQIRSKKELDIYSAWNLSANLFAKVGLIPWSISDEQLKHADLILGFSYSSLLHEGKLRRNIGYVNVFDKNGVWRFMRSHSSFLDFEKRKVLIPQLVKDAISSFMAGGSTPKIIDIHYSKKFSREERSITYRAIKELLPSIQQVNFISIDTDHAVLFFGNDKTVLNQTYRIDENSFLLPVLNNGTTTKLLKTTIWREEQSIPKEDIKLISNRVLAMTRLNWRSAVHETFEPVTIRYSHEIAKLTNKFSLTEWSTVNNQLSRIPWFI